MHGSSRGYIQRLLGSGTMDTLEAAGSIRFYNTEEEIDHAIDTLDAIVGETVKV